jgi:hypothetical protein
LGHLPIADGVEGFKLDHHSAIYEEVRSIGMT